MYPFFVYVPDAINIVPYIIAFITTSGIIALFHLTQYQSHPPHHQL